MSSNIEFSAIDAAYPVAGQDNNTQGFRDNFSVIKSGLEIAKSEITDLQTTSVKMGAGIVNNLLGATVSNGIYNKLYGAVHTETVSSSADIDLNNGPFQVFTLTGNATLRFNNWPVINQYALVRVHLKSDTVSARTPALTTVNAGTMVYEGTYPSPNILNINGKHRVIEAWSYDHGTHVYIRYLGEF
jgi:hypothetical protein